MSEIGKNRHDENLQEASQGGLLQCWNSFASSGTVGQQAK